MHNIIPANDLKTSKGIKTLKEALRQPSDWRDWAAKFALFIFGIVLWHKAAGIAAGSLLILVWILCGGLRQIKSVIKEPLMVAILSLCGVLLLGLSGATGLTRGVVGGIGTWH